MVGVLVQGRGHGKQSQGQRRQSAQYARALWRVNLSLEYADWDRGEWEGGRRNLTTSQTTTNPDPRVHDLHHPRSRRSFVDGC